MYLTKKKGEKYGVHLSPTRPYPTPLSEDPFIRKARPDVQGATTSLKTAPAGAGVESQNGEKEPPVHAPFSCWFAPRGVKNAAPRWRVFFRAAGSGQNPWRAVRRGSGGSEGRRGGIGGAGCKPSIWVQYVNVVEV